MLAEPVIRGVLLPVFVTAVVLAATARPWRRGELRARRWAAAPALGAGFLVAFVALFGWPAWPVKENWHWLAHAAIAGSVCGLVDHGTVRLGWLPWLLRAGVCAVGAWVLVPRFADLADTRWFWVVGLTLGSLLTWIALNQAGERAPAIVTFAALILCFAAASVLLGHYSSNARFAQLAGAMAAATGVHVVAAIWNREAVRPAAVAPIVALTFTGLMFDGRFYDWAGVPAVSFVLVAAAPSFLALASFPLVRRRSPATVSFTLITAELMVLGIALGLAARGHEPNPYG